MSYELGTQQLIHKTKEELLAQITIELEAYTEAEENYGEGEGSNHIGNIEMICYTLRNCAYKGHKDAA